MSSTIPIGVIGVGYLGRHHARILKSLPGADLVGIHDANGDRLKEIAAEVGTTAFSDLAKLVEQCDAFVVATPTTTHRAVAEPLLRAGKSVLVEKPLADTRENGEALVAAQTGNAILATGHVERFSPAVAVLLEHCKTPGFIEIHRLAEFKPRSLDVDVILDLMIHDLDLCLALARSPLKEVRAKGVAVLTQKVDIANVRLEFESGCVANLTASRVSKEPVRKIRVFEPHIYRSADTAASTLEEIEVIMGPKGPEIRRALATPDKVEPLAAELTDFLAAVREQRPPKVTGEAGLAALNLALDIIKRL
jgi:predicted dehydrogenase